MGEKNIILVTIVLTVGLMVGGVLLAMNWNKPAEGVEGVEAAADAKVVTEETSKDWGEIKMGDGIAKASFPVRNEGTETLKLFNGTTSCACTQAKIVTDSKQSGYFGMHAKSKNVTEIGPGEKGEVIVEFDPAFHGPSGVGPISRQITIATNDPNRPELVFVVTGTVIR